MTTTRIAELSKAEDFEVEAEVSFSITPFSPACQGHPAEGGDIEDVTFRVDRVRTFWPNGDVSTDLHDGHIAKIITEAWEKEFADRYERDAGFRSEVQTVCFAAVCEETEGREDAAHQARLDRTRGK
jgi:hypothetical protein